MASERAAAKGLREAANAVRCAPGIKDEIGVILFDLLENTISDFDKAAR